MESTRPIEYAPTPRASTPRAYASRNMHARGQNKSSERGHARSVHAPSDVDVMQKKDPASPFTWMEYEVLRDHLQREICGATEAFDADIQSVNLKVDEATTTIHAVQTQVTDLQASIQTVTQAVAEIRTFVQPQQQPPPEEDDSVHGDFEDAPAAHGRGVGRGVGRDIGDGLCGRGFVPVGSQRVPQLQDDGLDKPKFSILRFEGGTDVEDYLSWELKIEKLWRLHDYTEDRKESHARGLMGHFGREKTLLMLAGHFYWPKMRPDVDRVNMEASKRADFVRKIHEKTKELIEKKGKNNVARVNKKCKEMLFKSGDMVWVHFRKDRFPKLRKSMLLPRGAGPYKVLAKINDNAYDIDLPTDEFGVSNSFNVADLTLYDGEDLGASRSTPFEGGR
ncbi:hypothetical protein QYE76_066638 [Lolium multiflorum]|uniref:Uncharacterized protein n=1 Tax=Lolium multiflorum TaxID=4521 RepID=A0AAD8SBY8_LOLMU|nr:hypothetical protein QYE76_066638 [Lolium multiflorum]